MIVDLQIKGLTTVRLYSWVKSADFALVASDYVCLGNTFRAGALLSGSWSLNAKDALEPGPGGGGLNVFPATQAQWALVYMTNPFDFHALSPLGPPSGAYMTDYRTGCPAVSHPGEFISEDLTTSGTSAVEPFDYETVDATHYSPGYTVIKPPAPVYTGDPDNSLGAALWPIADVRAGAVSVDYEVSAFAGGLFGHGDIYVSLYKQIAAQAGFGFDGSDSSGPAPGTVQPGSIGADANSGIAR